MTRNQIEYSKLVESRRTNVSNEQLRASELDETKRHNIATETQARASLDEQSRANRAGEAETQRANMAREQHNRDVLAETKANNIRVNELGKANLEELKRSHQATEGLESQKIALQGHQLAETIRANQAREEETRRSNIAREQETNRSNLARESETNRANVARETETHRSNVTNEIIDTGRAATYAADVAARALKQSQNGGQSPAVVTVNPHITVNPYYDSGNSNSGKEGTLNVQTEKSAREEDVEPFKSSRYEPSTSTSKEWRGAGFSTSKRKGFTGAFGNSGFKGSFGTK